MPFINATTSFSLVPIRATKSTTTFSRLRTRSVFYRDSLQYPAAFPLTATNACAYVKALQLRLNSFHIKEYRGEPDGLGTEAMVHMQNGETVFYIKDMAQITYPATLDRIKKAHRLCENWYLEQDWACSDKRSQGKRGPFKLRRVKTTQSE